MVTIAIYFDLDETLVHSMVRLHALHDLRMHFSDGHDADIQELRARFDGLVAQRMKSAPGQPFAAAFRERITAEHAVSRDLLRACGWLDLLSEEPLLQNRIVAVRPGLAALLQSLSRRFSIHLCTSAGKLYAEACLRTAGVLELFDSLLSAEDIESDRQPSTTNGTLPLLVDNLDSDDAWIIRKLRFLGLPLEFDFHEAARRQLLFDEVPGVDRKLVRRHHLQVPPYHAQESDPGFESILPALQEKIADLQSCT